MPEQPGLFQTPPPRPEQAQAPLKAMARNTDPATSHMAAADATANLKNRHYQVLMLLFVAGPLTDFELAERAGLQQTSIGKRRGECRDKGWIEPDHVNGLQVRRPAPSGSMAQVWRLTADGREVCKAAIRARV